MTSQQKKTFAIDYDQTWTVAPAVFEHFAADLIVSGHRVLLVTARATGRAEVVEACEGHVHAIVFAERMMTKRQTCEKYGEHVDVWVDDMPEMVDQVR